MLVSFLQLPDSTSIGNSEFKIPGHCLWRPQHASEIGQILTSKLGCLFLPGAQLHGTRLGVNSPERIMQTEPKLLNFPKERTFFFFCSFVEDRHLQRLWEGNCGCTSCIFPLKKKV